MPSKDQDDPYSERPQDSDFQQQNLKAWQPLLTPAWVIGTFFVIGAIFIPVGYIIKMASDSVVEVERAYEFEGETKEITLNIPADMEPPIYMYYKLTNFYQNHRRYVKSRSDSQLRGDADPDLGFCSPDQVKENSTGAPYYPCGLIANSYFNDTFSSPTYKNGNITWTDEGIAWPSDVEKKFKYSAELDKESTETGYYGQPLPRVDDEAFIVWMRTAGLPTFKKLRYIIKPGGLPDGATKLEKGSQVTVSIGSNFPVKGFGGEKFICLSTVSWLGGKNDFLGFAYMAVGGICVFLALCFLIKHCVSPRELGDMRYFNFQGSK